MQDLNRKMRLLVVDPSASHLAYVICDIDPGKEATILKSGMLWTHDKWSLGKRLNYMKTSFSFLIQEFKVDKIYTEQFFMNPKMLTGGTAVIPTINAILQMCIDESRQAIEFEEIPPPSWRAVLGIKATTTKVGAKTKRDFKEPTKDHVRLSIQPPDRLFSNVTLKERDTPYDIYDALAIVLALTKKAQCNSLILGNNVFADQELLLKLRAKSDEDIMKGRFFGNGKD
jgi:Holliday junction resolvasome RuvABC endonuclease subunit